MHYLLGSKLGEPLGEQLDWTFNQEEDGLGGASFSSYGDIGDSLFSLGPIIITVHPLGWAALS